MEKIDSADLLILKELHRTRNISAAVEKIGLSQPSISIRLAKLRRHFEDALFVRTSHGMMPTPLMDELLPSLDDMIDMLAGRLGTARRFDPATSSRSFRLCISEIGQMVMLPLLLPHLARVAPRITFEALDLGNNTARQLESGEADLAIGFTFELQTGFFQQNLFTEDYACVLRAPHPRVRGRLTRQAFLDEGHVAVITPGTGYWMFDKVLADIGMARKMRVRIPSILALPGIIAATDLLAVIPARLAQSLATREGVRMLKLPMPSPSYQVQQFWHERYHRDAANRWLRQEIAGMFSDFPPAGSARGGRARIA